MILGISAVPATLTLLGNFRFIPPFVFWGLIGAIPFLALICGILTLSNLGRLPGRQLLRAMAIVGIVGFFLDVALAALILILAVSLKAALDSGTIGM
jgi:hypothetical protein